MNQQSCGYNGMFYGIHYLNISNILYTHTHTYIYIYTYTQYYEHSIIYHMNPNIVYNQNYESQSMVWFTKPDLTSHFEDIPWWKKSVSGASLGWSGWSTDEQLVFGRIYIYIYILYIYLCILCIRIWYIYMYIYMIYT